MMEVSESGGGVAMDFVMKDGASSPMPKKLKVRMMELEEAAYARSLGTIEDIEAKLRHARLRRQQFYEKMSRKARPKPRSASRSSLREDDLGQRIEARLQAAEHKRLSILASAQNRLARLDELRQAAKASVEGRCERERELLGSKVEFRVQQAEANRKLLLSAYRQRRANLKERISQSAMRRIAGERKFKERVCAAMHQKRVAAEKKRLGLLEAERRKASARMQQVQRAAVSVSHQREADRRKMMNRLEARLQKAKRQRAEFLRQRGIRMRKQADNLSRKIAKCWRRFLQSRTTYDLVKEYESLKINQKTVKSLPFEHLARMIEAPATLHVVKALLDRLDRRFRVYKSTSTSEFSSSLDNIDHLLRRVSSPKKKKSGGRDPRRSIARYLERVVLCAYMILSHPDAVLSSQGEREDALARSAEEFVREFELLTRVILKGPTQNSDQETAGSPFRRCTFRSQLAAFDRAWCYYLECFAVWKVKDAESLEEDLIRAACQLELSMIQTCKLSEDGVLSHDMKAIQKQVTEDQKLLREKLHHLSGDSGIQRMVRALAETRAKHYKSKEGKANGNSPGGTSSPTCAGEKGRAKKPSVVRSLFQEGSSDAIAYLSENEVIVNEFLHESQGSFAKRISNNEQTALQSKIRETMESAFWDSVIASSQGEEPNFDRVVQLVLEVRDELCEISPKTWKEEIHEAIDHEILSQLISSGNLDADYLGKLLQFSFSVLQKLSSPAQENEMKLSHQRFLNDLSDSTKEDSKNVCIITMVKGLRFLLQEIQELKKEISKARIAMMEPLLKGPAGVEYLRSAFAGRHGPPSAARSYLPLTAAWMSSIKESAPREWEEHKASLSSTVAPAVVMRTGVRSQNDPNATVTGIHESTGETVDLLVRLGLLNLVFRINGLSRELLPETLALNLARLRAVQAEIQKIVAVCTSILVFRQAVVMDRLASSGEEMESMVVKCWKAVVDAVDADGDADLATLVEAMSCCGEQEPSRKAMMAAMLRRSLQAGDPVFEKVSRAIFVAGRSLVLGGNSARSRRQAEAPLRQIGAHMLLERLAEAAQVLALVAVLSVSVHGPWYADVAGL